MISLLLQVVTDGLRRADGRYHGRVESEGHLQPPLRTEIKEGQWLGGAVTSQGEIMLHLPTWRGIEEIGQVGLRWKGGGGKKFAKSGDVMIVTRSVNVN